MRKNALVKFLALALCVGVLSLLGAIIISSYWERNNERSQRYFEAVLEFEAASARRATPTLPPNRVTGVRLEQNSIYSSLDASSEAFFWVSVTNRAGNVYYRVLNTSTREWTSVDDVGSIVSCFDGCGTSIFLTNLDANTRYILEVATDPEMANSFHRRHFKTAARTQ